MFDRLCPIYKRKLDMNRSDKYSDRYVIPMHRKNVWTNKWMQDHRKKNCRLVTMILVCSIEGVGEHINEKQD
jgi:hypothetical protein